MLYRTRFENEIASLLEFENTVTPGKPQAKAKPQTFFLPIELKPLPAKNKVGAHVPPAAAVADVIDVIVYFHGFIAGVCKEDGPTFDRDGMEYYWRHPLFRGMRRELDASGRCAVLIAPQLHKRVGALGSGAERYGNLHAAKAFDKLIKRVFDELIALKAIRAGAKPGNIVLAAHSGGGSPMRAILAAKNDLGPQIRACWGFECLYPLATTWVNWLNAEPSRCFRHFRQVGVMQNRVNDLVKVKHRNFVDTTTPVDPQAHCELIRNFWISGLAYMPRVAGSTDSF